ncbi:MAG: hypothetical protein GY861_09440 [bacterium]|nr:hypothetical protein [bacterium]
MNKKRIIPAAVVLVIIFLIMSYPSFLILKPYAHSGGFAPVPQNKICDCVGIDYSYYPKGCSDCPTSHYCLGVTKNCICYDESKVQEYRDKVDAGIITEDNKKEYLTAETFYSECP